MVFSASILVMWGRREWWVCFCVQVNHAKRELHSVFIRKLYRYRYKINVECVHGVLVILFWRLNVCNYCAEKIFLRRCCKKERRQQWRESVVKRFCGSCNKQLGYGYQNPGALFCHLPFRLATVCWFQPSQRVPILTLTLHFSAWYFFSVVLVALHCHPQLQN